MVDINKIRAERELWLTWKNIVPRVEAISSLPSYDNVEVEFDDIIKINIPNATQDDINKIEELAKVQIPWRKGPFAFNNLMIDTEWRSNIKYNLLKPYFDINDKIVGDIGCNNGYYLFRMLKEKPKRLVGFDPSAIFYSQFNFINHFIKSDIIYEMLGVEHIEYYHHKFDILFCLGVLYHRSDPITMLKSLYNSLNKNGELILDTFMIDGEDEIALTPNKRYSKIPNIYFIPTIPALINWCTRAGFKSVEVLESMVTTPNEQRATKWVYEQSLEDFLDPNDRSKTVEGYPAPKRVYIKAFK
ncbi:tRNA (5-methoxyuridine) 34 synthase [hydrothermal vent metagenome]|uniref:tRNA (5-methoxyuridine) 34 synthase n=1 Tax=hydrothermal vent metagenome TaxID=652676 RepID=A0A1W1EHZ4_9ZZZZ